MPDKLLDLMFHLKKAMQEEEQKLGQNAQLDKHKKYLLYYKPWINSKYTNRAKSQKTKPKHIILDQYKEGNHYIESKITLK